MTILYGLVVVVHLIGMAGVVGGWMSVVRQPRVVPAMVYGSLISLVTGLLLVGLSYPVFGGENIDNAKISVKLVVALAIAVLVWVNRTKDGIPKGLLHGIGLLAVLNVTVAVLWSDRFIG